ncbi:hypothetical protein F5882DRAFT_300883, partial [Hyaloscypha sp. PMI_1271]
VIWRLNMETSMYNVVLNDTATQPDPTLTASVGGIPFSINGVHTKEGFLYFTYTALGFFRVSIYHDGIPVGNVEVLAKFISRDGFTFDSAGNAYVARGRVDLIRKITPARRVVSLDYENPDALVLIEGNTVAKFGGTKSDRRILYVTTNVRYTRLVNGTDV